MRGLFCTYEKTAVAIGSVFIANATAYLRICSIVIIINSVLTLQVSTAKPMIADLAE